MILIPEEFLKEHVLSKDDKYTRKLKKKLEKKVNKLEKYLKNNKVCLEEITYETQLIKARQELHYTNHIFCGDEFLPIKEDKKAINEVIEIILDKKAYEIIDKKKLRYDNRVAAIKDLIGEDPFYKENFDLIKEKKIEYMIKEEIRTYITYIYKMDYLGYDSFVSNIEDGTILNLLNRYIELCY